MTKSYDKPHKKSLVDDYSRINPRVTRHRDSVEHTLRKTDFWLTTRQFFSSEVMPILDGKIRLDDTRCEEHMIPDILFEYLVIRSVTILEIQLKYYCNIYAKEFPKRAELLLKNRDSKKDLSLQILSTYSFSNLDDIQHVFSTLLGKNFFQILRHRSEEQKSSIGYESDHLRRASPLFKKWGMFKQLINLRNKLIHENEHIKIKSKIVKKNLLNTIYEVNYHTSSEQHYLPYNDDSFSEIKPQY